MRKILLSFLVFSFFAVHAQTSYRTQIFNPAIKTLQINLVGQKFSLPVIDLNGQDALQVSFDEMSHGAHAYSYKVIHCNADWTVSDLSTNQYLTGYSTVNITDVTKSLNTTFLYTHYAFQLPNSDMSF
ncbi:MAG: type IX secretion system plug protein domain-containing protein, partial [Opitutaceae bacterium]